MDITASYKALVLMAVGKEVVLVLRQSLFISLSFLRLSTALPRFSPVIPFHVTRKEFFLRSDEDENSCHYVLNAIHA